MGMTIRNLMESSKSISEWLEWELESLEDFHAYGQLYGSPGQNVYTLVLADALRLRGITLEQLREQSRLSYQSH